MFEKLGINNLIRVCNVILSKKIVWIILGPLLGVSVSLLSFSYKLDYKMASTLGICVLMIVYWISGAVAMGVTGLLPIFLFPLFGIISGESVAEAYFSDSIIVCLGSLLITNAIEKYGLTGRFGRFILHKTKSGNFRILLFAFVMISGFFSMWLSNTATAALLTPLAKAIFKDIRDESANVLSLDITNAAIAVDFAIAYGKFTIYSKYLDTACIYIYYFRCIQEAH
jgi:sodium-dependent dicarboxylate transporter 2/3/5